MFDIIPSNVKSAASSRFMARLFHTIILLLRLQRIFFLLTRNKMSMYALQNLIKLSMNSATQVKF